MGSVKGISACVHHEHPQRRGVREERQKFDVKNRTENLPDVLKACPMSSTAAQKVNTETQPGHKITKPLQVKSESQF